MKLDDDLSQLKDAWQSTPAPDTAGLARKIRTARLRGRLMVALEIALTLLGTVIGVSLMFRSGWFAGVIGAATIGLCFWALFVSLSIRRQATRCATDTVRGQLGQLMSNARTNLRLVRAGHIACAVALAFVVFILAGSLLGLPGAPGDMAWRVAFAVVYLAAFAALSRWYGRRVARELERLQAIDAALKE